MSKENIKIPIPISVDEWRKLGYTDEESQELFEASKIPVTISSDINIEEIERIADEFSRIGCTTFSLKYNPEIREIFKEDILNNRIEKLECSVEDFKRLGYTDEEAEELYKHINIYI